MTLRIAVVGAGAIGSYIGAHLMCTGYDVTLIDQYPRHVDTIQTNGLRISGVGSRDNFSTPVNAIHVHEVQALHGKPGFDVALICMKAYDTAWSTALIAPFLAKGGAVASVQNGINEDVIAGIVGWERTLGVVISGCGVDLVKPGEVRRSNVSASDQTVFRVGEIHGRLSERCRRLADALSNVDSASVTDNLSGERWSKLVINAMRSGVAALTGASIVEQSRNDTIRSIMVCLAAEALRVGRALGFSLSKVHGIEPETMLLADAGDLDANAEVARHLCVFASRYSDSAMPSLVQDVARGRRTEIDALSGLIVAKGELVEIATPMNRFILKMVQQLESGQLAAGAHVITQLAHFEATLGVRRKMTI